jgi:hypothetical protein
VGGVDGLTRVPSLPVRILARVFLYDSGTPGCLSPSGFTGAMVRWPSVGAPFTSEFLSGCNMSFRRSALEDIRAVPWLRGYSLGEDVYISTIAGAKGALVVDPALRVRHAGSVVARESPETTGLFVILNPYHLLRLRGGRWWNYLALHWTAIGLMGRALGRRDRLPLVLAYVKGLREVHRQIWRGAPSDSLA